MTWFDEKCEHLYLVSEECYHVVHLPTTWLGKIDIT